MDARLITGKPITIFSVRIVPIYKFQSQTPLTFLHRLC